jgi:hypothetical protein
MLQSTRTTTNEVDKLMNKENLVPINKNKD